MTVIDHLLIFITATILTSHTGIAYAGILLTPGNILDWLPVRINKIKSPYLQDLLQCSKCISGQFALWIFVGLSIHFHLFHWFFSPVACIAWVCWVIVVTDQLFKKYGYG